MANPTVECEQDDKPRHSPVSVRSPTLWLICSTNSLPDDLAQRHTARFRAWNQIKSYDGGNLPNPQCRGANRQGDAP
jgi:hypothetical protein